MERVRRFLTRTPFVRWLFVSLFLLLLAIKVAGWGKRYAVEVLVPRAEAYVYEKLVPRVAEQARKAVEEGIRNGANGAASDLTGGLLGHKPSSGALTGPGSAATNGADPCRVQPSFGLPGLPLRLP